MYRQFAGLHLSRPLIMGVINVTPDSFSDGGETFDSTTAVKRGIKMYESGADILDIGGESTRPGSVSIGVEEEIRRVVPVIENLAGCGARISIDTCHAEVMMAAMKAGAEIINDVTALSGDPYSLDVAANFGASVILMHMNGSPETMQDNPCYDDAPLEVKNFLISRIGVCRDAGINKAKIAIDPGIGFGKSLEHNLEILNKLDLFTSLEYPVVIGLSRKNFIGLICEEDNPKSRLPGSIASAALARDSGVQIFRVHDVPETLQALTLVDAIRGDSN